MRSCLLTLFFAVSALHAASNDPWPGQRGNAQGQAACRTDAPNQPVGEWHFRGKRDIRYQQGLAVWASPALAVVEGKPMAFIGGCDQTMHALDLATQKQAWYKICNGIIADAPVVGLVEERPVVYWGSADRTLYAHFAETGERLWTRELIPPSNTLGEMQISAPLLLDHVLYVTCFAYDKALARNDQKGWLYALDPETGALKWKIVVNQGPLNAPAGCQIDGLNYVFVTARKGLLQAFNVSGDIPLRRWTFQMPHEVMGAPALEVQGNPPTLFLGSKFGDLMAIDAKTGVRRWHRMTGSWIDNNACVASVDGRNVVFVGSHDYCVYALDTQTGDVLWKRPLGGEVYSAPCFFHFQKQPAVAVASLDNHITVINARTGTVIASFFTGEPVWDKVSKGETLWGSPVVLEDETGASIILHGSYSGYVFTLPLAGTNSLRTEVQDTRVLWLGLGICFVLFTCVILPALWFWPIRSMQMLLLLLAVTSSARAGEVRFSLTPATPELFDTYSGNARTPPPPAGCLVMVGRMDAPDFSIDHINQLTAVLPSGKIIPLQIDEKRTLREFGKIISLDFYITAPESEFSGTGSEVVLRWVPNISADNHRLADFSFDPAQADRFRILSPLPGGTMGEREEAFATAAIQVIADNKAGYIPLWYLLPMGLIFLLLGIQKLKL